MHGSYNNDLQRRLLHCQKELAPILFYKSALASRQMQFQQRGERILFDCVLTYETLLAGLDIGDDDSGTAGGSLAIET
jgi:hypothetical protein